MNNARTDGTTLPRDDFGERIQALRPGVARRIDIGAASVASPAFGTSTVVIRVTPTRDCFFAVGTAPTAGASTHYLVGGATEYFRVVPGERIAVASASDLGGTLFVSEMT